LPLRSLTSRLHRGIISAMRWSQCNKKALRLCGVMGDLGFSRAQVVRVMRGAQYVRFVLALRGGSIEHLEARARTIANELGELPGHVTVSPGRGVTNVDVYLHAEGDRRDLSLRNMPGADVWPAAPRELGLATPYNPLAFWLGLSLDGFAVAAHVNDSRQPHLGIFGSSGAGKTNLMEYILLQAARRTAHVQLAIADPRNRMAGADHFFNMAIARADDMGTRRDLVFWAADEIEQREVGQTPALLVVLDELGAILDRDGARIRAFESLISQGRNVGAYLILADQKPLASEIGSRGRAQVGNRCVGPVENKLGRTMVAAGRGAGASAPGRGAFWFVRMHSHQTWHIQAPLVRAEDWRYWEVLPPRVDEVPVIPHAAHGGAGLDDLVPEVVAWLAAERREAVSQNAIRAQFAVGVTRAQRVISQLESIGVLTGERASDNSGYRVAGEMYEEG